MDGTHLSGRQRLLHVRSLLRHTKLAWILSLSFIDCWTIVYHSPRGHIARWPLMHLMKCSSHREAAAGGII